MNQEGYYIRKWMHRAILSLCIVGLIEAIASSSISTVWSVYLKSFLNEDKIVGIFASVLTASYTIAYFVLTPILEKYHKARLFSISIWGIIATWLLYSFNKNIYIFLAVSILSIAFFILNSSSLGMLIRYHSKLNDIGKYEGFRYTLLNLGWLIGPLIGGFLAERYGIRAVFMFGAIFMVLAAFFFRSKHYKDGIAKNITPNAITNLRGYISDMERVKHYITSMGISGWWGIVYIFGPLFIIENGMRNFWIGIYLFLVSVPLVILEYPLGERVHKIGYRRFFLVGYFIMGFFSLMTFLVQNPYHVITMIALASIGAAFVEPTREAYYFHIVRKEESEKYYGPYQTSMHLGNSLGVLVGSAIISIFTFKSIFLVFAVMLFLFGLSSIALKRG